MDMADDDGQNGSVYFIEVRRCRSIVMVPGIVRNHPGVVRLVPRFRHLLRVNPLIELLGGDETERDARLP